MKNLIKTNDEFLVDESLLFTGNGYVGIRGNLEEGYPNSWNTIRGTYLNGFYDITDITYGESAYGFPKEAQKIVNVSDAQTIRLWIGDEEFRIFQGQILKMERKLDIDQGIAIRNIEWVSPKGHHVRIVIERMTSFTQLELAVIRYRVYSYNYEGPIRIVSTLNGDVRNYTDANDPRVSSDHAHLLFVEKVMTKKDRMQIVSKTSRSKLQVAVTVGHSLAMDLLPKELMVETSCRHELKIGKEVELIKYIVYTDSRRHKKPHDEGFRILEESLIHPWKKWQERQKRYVHEFFHHAKVRIAGDPSVEEAINYNIYQLLASAGKDGISNVSAKGLSGEGYEGHYFWDTEIYLIPFFTLTNPEIAKKLLRFRYETLDASRKRASELGHKKGAKVAWRTISGSECSGYFPAGCAQYHINADVAYSWIQYYLYTKDIEFIKEFGFEVLFETARIWLDMGHYDHKGQFMIHDVTGPDEYSAIVNNNYYTNAMAAYHMLWVWKFYEVLKNDVEVVEHFRRKFYLEEEEVTAMKTAADQMYYPFSEDLDIHLQDDGFINKAEWDFKATPKENYPLLLHYHPLIIYRHKVLKQADTLLAYMLLDQVPQERIKKAFHYYERLTTHDSSLSPCIHSIVASRVEEYESAYHYLMKTARLDLDNLHHNTKDGLHIANAGGAYMTILYGFGGLRIKEDGLYLKPAKPSEWKSIDFRIYYQGATVNVHISDMVRIETDRAIEIFVWNIKYFIRNELQLDFPYRNSGIVD